MVWLEVETKVKLDSNEVPKLRKRIKEIAKLKKEGTKTDDYFAVQQETYPKKAFRIRATKDRFEVTFKKHLKKYWTKEVVVKQEFEFALEGKEQVEDFLELFQDLGIKEWVRKIKRNETYQHNKHKKISIEINKVKHLGYFMEIEYLCQKNEIKRAIRIITNTLKELEIDFKKVDNTGYTRLLWDRGFKGTRDFLE